jgi:hypothetical protein
MPRSMWPHPASRRPTPPSTPCFAANGGALRPSPSACSATALAADPFFVASDQPLAFYVWAGVWIAAVVALTV